MTSFDTTRPSEQKIKYGGRQARDSIINFSSLKFLLLVAPIYIILMSLINHNIFESKFGQRVYFKLHALIVCTVIGANGQINLLDTDED